MPLKLLADPWIPVRRASGAQRLIRVAEIADQNDPPVALDWPRADFNLACLELLTGLVFVACPPKDDDAWWDVREAPPDPAALDEALAPYVAAFELDGAGPRFLQDFEALDAGPTGVDALLIDASGGNTARNNADLMVHRGRYAVFSRSAAAMALYTLQAFAPSGGAGNRTSMRGGGPMVTLVEPRPGGEGAAPALWDTVWANVPDGRPLPVERMSEAFPWMAPTPTSQTKGSEVHADPDRPPWQAFFGMPRRIRLLFEQADSRRCDLTGAADATVVTGFLQRPYGINYGHWMHPLTPYYRQKPGEVPLPVHPKPGRFGYRNWIGVALSDEPRNPDKVQRQPAATVTGYTRNRGQPGEAVRLIVGGWAMDNMKPLDFIEARQPLYVVEDDDRRKQLETAALGLVRAGEIAAGELRMQLKRAIGLDSADKGAPAEASEAFFARTENDFHEALRRLSIEPEATAPRKAWRRALMAAALGEFDRRVLPGLTDRDPAGAETAVRARGRLLSVLSGYGKRGQELYDAHLGLSVPESARKKEKAE